MGCSSEFVSDLIELSSRDKMKNNKKKLSEILQDNPRMMLDWEAAVVIKNITNTPIEIPEEMDVIRKSGIFFMLCRVHFLKKRRL